MNNKSYESRYVYFPVEYISTSHTTKKDIHTKHIPKCISMKWTNKLHKDKLAIKYTRRKYKKIYTSM